MKTAMRWLAGVAVGLLAGCASESNRDPIFLPSTMPTTMNASYSSDVAGVQTTDQQPVGDYLPPQEMDFDQLPPAVQVTIAREAGDVLLDKIVRVTRKGET